MIRDPKVGEVLAYHPILTRPDHVQVAIECEPYQLGDGTWIVKARRGDGRRVYPCLEALDRLPSAAGPQKVGSEAGKTVPRGNGNESLENKGDRA